MCGSDNITYNNRCTLRVSNCKAGTQVTVQYVGKCNDDAGSSAILEDKLALYGEILM